MFFKNKIKKIKKNQKGFSLIEVLVGFSVLMMIIVTLMSLASQSIAVVNFSRDQSVASFLAQDAMEYIANKIEENKNNGVPDWLSGFRVPCEGMGTHCVVETINLVGIDASPCGASCPALLYDSVTGLFSYSAGIPTHFTREVNLSEFLTGDEVSVTVTVDWISSAATRQLINKKNIFKP